MRVDFLCALVAMDPSFNCCAFTAEKANCPDFSNSLVNFVDVDTAIK